MVLLTSSQVSVALSSAIVCLSAVALFIAGYVLQRQTVQSLQDSIKPRLPSPHANANANANVIQATQKGQQPAGQINQGDRQKQHAGAQELVHVNWNRLAYLTVVKSHEELCSAVMLLADLVRSKSPAQRVMLFPQHWALEGTDGSDDKEEDPQLYTTRRLLKKAARRYRTVLVPMVTVRTGMDEKAASSYSMAPAFSLRDYDRVVLLPQSGVVLGSMPLDSFLAFSEPADAVSSLIESTDLLEAPLIIQPGKADYTSITTRLRSSPDPIADTSLLRDSFSAIPVLPTLDDGTTLYTTTSSLHVYPANPGPATEFNATHFLKHTAFVRLADDNLPGPEFDIPYAIRAQVGPRNDDARKVWERMYEKFRAGRQDVCGLELEPWSPPVSEIGEEL